MRSVPAAQSLPVPPVLDGHMTGCTPQISRVVDGKVTELQQNHR